MISQSGPDAGKAELQALLRVYERGQWAHGEDLELFEKELGDYLGYPPVVATCNGFSSLHLALLSLNLPPASEVITTCISTCAAVRDAIVAAGHVPIFADTLVHAPNLDPTSVGQRLTARTGAILCPHHFGLAAPLIELLELGIPVVEDCAQALGVVLQGRLLGSWGARSGFSFYPTKLLASIDGGAVAGAQPEDLERIRDLRYYGGKNDSRARLNYKMPNLHAALARVQLQRLPLMLERRRRISDAYVDGLLASGLSPTNLLQGQVAFRLGLKTAPGKSQELITRLSQRQIPVRAEYQALCCLDDFPRGRRWTEQFVSLPTYSALSDSEVEFIGTHLPASVQVEDFTEWD